MIKDVLMALASMTAVACAVAAYKAPAKSRRRRVLYALAFTTTVFAGVLLFLRTSDKTNGVSADAEYGNGAYEVDSGAGEVDSGAGDPYEVDAGQQADDLAQNARHLAQQQVAGPAPQAASPPIAQQPSAVTQPVTTASFAAPPLAIAGGGRRRQTGGSTMTVSLPSTFSV